VVIYGESWVGKTTLAYAIARRIGNALYLDTDHNYKFPENGKVKVVRVRSFGEASKVIENNTGDVVVVDSVSGLIANLFEVMGVGNPRTVLVSSQSQERLIKSAKKNFKTVIIVAHVGANFRSGEEKSQDEPERAEVRGHAGQSSEVG
jgi:predicted ATP-dependent serine protease